MLAATSRLSPVMTFSDTPRALQLRDGVGNPGLGWVVESEESQERKTHFAVFADRRLRPQIPIGYGQRAKTLGAQRGKSLPDLFSHRAEIDDRSPAALQPGADCQHVLQSAFGHHQMPTLGVDENTQTLAQEVVGHLVQLPVASQVELAVGANGLVDGVDEA